MARTKQTARGTTNARAFTALVAARQMPRQTSITYQGVLNEHCYRLREVEKKDVINEEVDCGVERKEEEEQGEKFVVWLSVLLKSKLDGQPRGPRAIDVVIALDISGSMSSRQGSKTKMELAKIAIKKLYVVMRKNDRLGMCTFTHETKVIFPIEEIGSFSLKTLTKRLAPIQPGGGEDLSKGFSTGLSLFKKWERQNPEEDFAATGRERRMLFVTDMCSAGGELGTLVKNAKEKQKIYTTIIGLGLDFNTDLTESVVKVTGANYFATKDENDLDEIMARDFHYNFFPSCHNNRLACSSDQFSLMHIYGTPLAADTETIDYEWLPRNHRHFPKELKDRAFTLLLTCKRLKLRLPMIVFSNIMDMIAPREVEVSKLETMFPSNLFDSKVEGGLMMLKLRPKDETITKGTIGIGVTWTNLDGSEETRECSVEVDVASAPEVGTGTGNIDKGYALTRYVECSHQVIKKQKLSPTEEKDTLDFQNWFASQTSTFDKDKRFDTRVKDFKSLLQLAGVKKETTKPSKTSVKPKSKLKTKTDSKAGVKTRSSTLQSRKGKK